MSRLLWVALFAVVAAVPASAQVVYPKRPDQYDVTLRYRIRAAGDQRVGPFQALAKHLQAIGFRHADEERFKLDLLDPGERSAVLMLGSSNSLPTAEDGSVPVAISAPGSSRSSLNRSSSACLKPIAWRCLANAWNGPTRWSPAARMRYRNVTSYWSGRLG